MAKKNNNLKPNKNHPQSPNQQNETSEASFVKQALSFSGPLPLPQILEQYNKINSTFAERIVVMAEKQAAHRQEQEKTGLIAEIECDKSRIKAATTSAIIGLIFGFIISIIAIGGGIWCILKGYEFGGGFIGTGGVVSLATVFVVGSKRKENK